MKQVSTYLEDSEKYEIYRRGWAPIIWRMCAILPPRGCGDTSRLLGNNGLHVLSFLRLCSGGAKLAVCCLADGRLQNFFDAVMGAHMVMALVILALLNRNMWRAVITMPAPWWMEYSRCVKSIGLRNYTFKLNKNII